MQKNDRRLKLSLSLHRNFVKVLLITAAFKAGERRWDAGNHINLFLHRQLGRASWMRLSEKWGWKWPPPTLRERVATPRKNQAGTRRHLHRPWMSTSLPAGLSTQCWPRAMKSDLRLLGSFAMEREAPLSLCSTLHYLFLTWFVNKTLSKNASHGDNRIKLAFPLTQNLAWNAQRKDCSDFLRCCYRFQWEENFHFR